MAGLLTCPLPSLPAEMAVALISGKLYGLTAAGTVPVSHRIPFSIAQPGRACNHHNKYKYRLFYTILSEYHLIFDQEIQKSRKEHRCKAAEHYIPPGKAFYQEQDAQAQQEYRRTRKIIGKIKPEES